jgi:hypothetical protein
VRAAVIFAFHPRGEQPIQLGQGHQPVIVDLDQELLAHGAEESLHFSAALRPARRRMDDFDAEFRGRPFQRGVDERGPVIDAMPTSA